MKANQVVGFMPTVHQYTVTYIPSEELGEGAEDALLARLGHFGNQGNLLCSIYPHPTKEGFHTAIFARTGVLQDPPGAASPSRLVVPK